MTVAEQTFELLCESDVSEVYDIPYSIKYEVVSGPFGTKHQVKAYARAVTVDKHGGIHLDIVRKTGSGRKVEPPFNVLVGNVLCAYKRYKHMASDSFALNHELFALEWNAAIIAHNINGVQHIFVASRDEWMKNGRAGHQNEELQVFMEVPDWRCISVPDLPVGDDVRAWLARCAGMQG